MLCVPDRNLWNFSPCTLWLLLSNKKCPWLTGLPQYVFAIAKSAEEVLLKALVFVARSYVNSGGGHQPLYGWYLNILELFSRETVITVNIGKDDDAT